MHTSIALRSVDGSATGATLVHAKGLLSDPVFVGLVRAEQPHPRFHLALEQLPIVSLNRQEPELAQRFGENVMLSLKVMDLGTHIGSGLENL